MKQTGGQMIETGSGVPVILFKGVSRQYISTAAIMPDTVIIRINNPSGVGLLKPLTVPYRIELIKGVLFTTESNLLTLPVKGSIITDSTTDAAFVDGPLRKEGLAGKDNFLFPVGKNNIQRWLCLKNATGSFTIEYFRNDPHSLSGTMGADMHHISSLEYWSVKASASSASAISLSYNKNSGGVSDLATLRVAKWNSGGTWQNAGNAGITGTAGASGSVTSTMLTGLTESSSFALGSSSAEYNILPLNRVTLSLPSKPDVRSRYGIRSVTASRNMVTCIIHSDIPRMVWIELVAMNGSRIQLSTYSLIKGKNTLLMNPVHLPSGVYIIRMADNSSISGKPSFYGTYRFFVLGQ